MRIRQNDVLGYFVDVKERHAGKHESPPYDAVFTRRQGISNAVRYASQAKADLERQIAGARVDAQAWEQNLF